MKRTGNEFDFAINGPGFFHIRGDDGQQYLSRAGEFHLDSQGLLVTQNGQRPVLDQQGAEIKLSQSVPFDFSNDGFIHQAGNTFALGMSKPDSLNDMVKIGNNLWKAEGPTKPLELKERNVRQGY